MSRTLFSFPFASDSEPTTLVVFLGAATEIVVVEAVTEVAVVIVVTTISTKTILATVVTTPPIILQVLYYNLFQRWIYLIINWIMSCGIFVIMKYMILMMFSIYYFMIIWLNCFVSFETHLLPNLVSGKSGGIMAHLLLSFAMSKCLYPMFYNTPAP